MIKSIIDADPTTIIIVRHYKVANAGGYSWVESDTTSYGIVVRLYYYAAGTTSMRNMKEFTMPEGEVKSVVGGMLAEYGVDIEVDHDSYDTFIDGGREYRIVGKRIYDDINLPHCVQCDFVAV